MHQSKMNICIDSVWKWYNWITSVCLFKKVARVAKPDEAYVGYFVDIDLYYPFSLSEKRKFPQQHLKTIMGDMNPAYVENIAEFSISGRVLK